MCIGEAERLRVPAGNEDSTHQSTGVRRSSTFSRRGMCLHSAACCASDDIESNDGRRQHAAFAGGAQKRCNRTPSRSNPIWQESRPPSCSGLLDIVVLSALGLIR